MNNKFSNNFNVFKKDFEIETGLKAKDNMALYIQYANTRFLDWNLQINHRILEELSSPNSTMNDKLRY